MAIIKEQRGLKSIKRSHSKFILKSHHDCNQRDEKLKQFSLTKI